MEGFEMCYWRRLEKMLLEKAGEDKLDQSCEKSFTKNKNRNMLHGIKR